MTTIIQQNTQTGCFEIIKGQMNEADTFYNGRAFGLNSTMWTNEKPSKNAIKWVGAIKVGYRNSPYGYTLELTNELR